MSCPDSNFYVITPIFNPMGFKSRIRLYNNFAKHMAESGAILVTVEAAFGDKPFVVTDSKNHLHVQVRTNQLVWHKERLINMGIARLRQVIPSARYIGWFDADVTFLNPDWLSESIHKLNHHCFIQPFGEAINLNSREEYMWNCPSSIRSFLEGRGYHQDPPVPMSYIFKGHPGLAWAATTDALDAVGGLYEVCIAGSADTVMSNCLKGQWDAYLPGTPSPGLSASIKRWANRCDQHIRGNIGYTRGALAHHWHGKSGDRGYEKRWSITFYHQFDPDMDLVMDSQGLYRWAGNKPRLENDMQTSLFSRNEDD